MLKVVDALIFVLLHKTKFIMRLNLEVVSDVSFIMNGVKLLIFLKAANDLFTSVIEAIQARVGYGTY